LEGEVMRSTRVTLPELGLIAGTRGLLGFGIGLLLSSRFSEEQRKAIGWTAFLVGAVSTIPLAIEVLGRPHLMRHPAELRPGEREESEREKFVDFEFVGRS
jgi:hypothetical protein